MAWSSWPTNPKFKIRNTREARKQSQILKEMHPVFEHFVLEFCASYLFRISSFGFRVLPHIYGCDASLDLPARSCTDNESQMRTVKSPEPETSRVPSGLHATEWT